MRKSVDEMLTGGHLLYGIPMTGVFVETLLDRAMGDDVAEAEATIARLAAAPAEGSVIREVWLLRMRALLARARGDETGYCDYGTATGGSHVARLRRAHAVGRGNAVTLRQAPSTRPVTA